jgi:hypothetical protein
MLTTKLCPQLSESMKQQPGNEVGLLYQLSLKTSENAHNYK